MSNDDGNGLDVEFKLEMNNYESLQIGELFSELEQLLQALHFKCLRLARMEELLERLATDDGEADIH